MFGFGTKTCQICGSNGRVKNGFRVPDRLGAFVCAACYQAWERGGRTCAECQSSVRGPQEVGAFVDRRTLGHVDCGGLKMFAA